MSKKNIYLILILVILGGIYVVFFTDWFKTKTVRIYSAIPPVLNSNTPRRHAPIIFGLIGHFRLNEVRVVVLADYQKNPQAPSLWHLISDSNSIPVERFGYGQRIHGMRPAVAGEAPQELETNVVYRLLVTASGGIKGSHDFRIK